MRMMSEKGWEVHYASMGEEEILDCNKSFVVPFTRSPFKLSNITAYKQLKKIINQENYDIIHTHTPMGSVVTRLAAKKARKNGTKIIYTAHGFHFFKGAPLLNWLIYYCSPLYSRIDIFGVLPKNNHVHSFRMLNRILYAFEILNRSDVGEKVKSLQIGRAHV